MIKKVIVGLFVALMIGAVVVGIVELANPSSHVLARKGHEETEQQTAQNQYGLGGGSAGPGAWDGQASQPQGSGRGGRQDSPGTEALDTPRTGGSGAQGNRSARSGGASAAKIAVWETVGGTVIETIELVVETGDGQTVQIGLGPSHYRDTQGFTIQVGDQVQADGYWEDGEFKAVQVGNLTTGAQITLRDAAGRPMWAGQGRGS